MNCHTFRGLLHEYLDEALDAGVLDTARRHVQHCDACRQALLREQAVASSIRQSLDQATAHLCVRPGMRLGVLEALERKPSPWAPWAAAWQRFAAVRPAGAVAVAMGAVLFLLFIQFYRRAPERAAHRAVAVPVGTTYVIDVPLPAQTHVFRMKDNAVVDAVADESAVANVRLSLGDIPPPSAPLPTPP
jgi:anti-sigma factor RsiW